jgi:capsular polysaccharide export protein
MMASRSASTARLRLVPGILRAPPVGRPRARTSETAIAGAADGVGWVERALLDMPREAVEAPERISDLVRSVVERRVGGDFWAQPTGWPSRVSLAAKVKAESQLDRVVELALGVADAGEVGVLLPRRAWSAAAARRLARRGVSAAIGPADPWAVLDQAATVIVDGDDELGLLALLAGKSVHCLSPGYLSGWGLTVDSPGVPSRGRRQVWQLAAAALVLGVRYNDVYSGRVSSCEAVVEQLSDWRRAVDEDRDLACLAGIALWKRARLREFLAPGARRTPVSRRAEQCVARAKANGGAIAVWPSRAPDGLYDLARRAGASVRQVEDGFLRSVGLGSDLLPPCSVVIDRRGVYYDPSRTSDLEAILAETDFTDAQRRRARGLIDRLVAHGLTKYNTGGGGYARPAAVRVVLVPGQVEDDQSLSLGGADCQGNLDLLRRVREREPDAFVVYKPHPDVEAGNRVGAVEDSEVLLYANQIVRGVAMATLLDSVDAIHTLTSLTGFEALMRGREVIVHGQPFYAGWGLTQDLAPPPRRGRVLSLSELVAGTLILYPRYVDPVTGMLCSPEVLVERFSGQRVKHRATTDVVRRVRRPIEVRIQRRRAAARPSMTPAPELQS